VRNLRLVNPAVVAANIEAGNTVEIRAAIESRHGGMQILEQSLTELVRLGAPHGDGSA
jgi:Tfp pilus assembly ATPase PilU